MSFPRDLKESVWAFARQMMIDGIAHRAQGNISLRQASSGLIAVTPSAIPYDRLQVDDINVVDLEGRVVEGEWRPTSELSLHLAFYRARACYCQKQQPAWVDRCRLRLTADLGRRNWPVRLRA